MDDDRIIKKVTPWDRPQSGERSWSRHLMSILDIVELLTYENMQPCDITYFIGKHQLEQMPGEWTSKNLLN